MANVVFACFFVVIAAVCIEQLAGENPKTWCVAKPSADDIKLQKNIYYACHQAGVDCNIISSTTAVAGYCYSPNTTINHASVAMNMYYQLHKHNTGACDFNDTKGNPTGLITTTDPSYDPCEYGYSP